MVRLPELGVGAVYVSAIDEILREDLVAVVEVEPQTLWYPGGTDGQSLRMDEEAYASIRSLEHPKLLHGIGYPVGGTRPPDPSQLPLLRRMIDELSPPWMSEHLSFNEAEDADGPFKTGFLLPPRQTPSGVDAAVRSIGSMAVDVGIPLAVETGVSYLRPRADEMEDGEFVAAVAAGADCGVLLDLHNLWTNERNGRQTVEAFVEALPVERVWEIHLAGGSERGGFWLDSHSDVVPEELFAVAREVVPALPNLRAIIYEVFPSYAAQVGYRRISRQIERLWDLWELRGRGYEASRGPSSILTTEIAAGPTPAEWETVLGALCVGRPATGRLAAQVMADPGLRIIRSLLGEFRASMVVATLRLSSRLLMLALGPQAFRGLLESFWAVATPAQFSAAEGLGFAHFLKARELDVPYLGGVLDYEVAVIGTLTKGRAHVVDLPWDPGPVFEALTEGHLPPADVGGSFRVEVTPDEADQLEETATLHLQRVLH